MKNIFIMASVMIAIAISSVDVFSYPANTVSGKIVMLRVEGAGNFYYLKDNNGRKIFLDGVGQAVDNPSKQWMSKAEGSGQTITLRGNIVKDGDGFTFENGSYELVSPIHNVNVSNKSDTNIDNNKIGPIIMGFQLGMPLQQAINIAKKESFTITDHNFINGYLLYKDGIPLVTLGTDQDKKIIKYLDFRKGVFNPDPRFRIDDNFIHRFLDHYKIDYSDDNISYATDHLNRTTVNIKNSDDGYQLTIGPDDVKLGTIPKSSDIQFR